MDTLYKRGVETMLQGEIEAHLGYSKNQKRLDPSNSRNGYGKKTSHNDYRVTNRGGKGIIGIVNSPRNGNITSSFPVNEGDEITFLFHNTLYNYKLSCNPTNIVLG